MRRILLLSRDRSGLDETSATAKRWRLLVQPESELLFIVLSPERGTWSEPGLRVLGTGGASFLKRWWRAKKIALEQTSMDLISAQDPLELGLLALWLGRKKQRPVEIQDHGGFFDEQPNGEPYWGIRRFMVTLARHYAASIRTVSPYSFSALRRMRGDDSAYWLPIAPDDRFRQVLRIPEPGLIVAIGRLVKVKQFDVLLAAFALVHQERKQARLVILGEGPGRAALEARIRALALTNVVMLLGTMDPVVWLAKAAVFVMPSLHEGWGVAAVEAALVGVPVVISATGCASWLAEQGIAEVVPLPIEQKVLAEAIIRGFGRSVMPVQKVPTAQHIAKEQWVAWNKVITSFQQR